MKNNLLVDLHRKALCVLDAYYEAERRAYYHEKELRYSLTDKMSFEHVTHYHEKRLKVNKGMMPRLQAYYTRIIEKINQHKP